MVAGGWIFGLFQGEIWVFLEPLFEGAPSAGYLNGGLVEALVAPGFGGIARAVATPLGGVRARASRELMLLIFALEVSRENSANWLQMPTTFCS